MSPEANASLAARCQAVFWRCTRLSSIEPASAATGAKQAAPLHALQLPVVAHQQQPRAGGAVRRQHDAVQDVRVQHRRLVHDHHRARGSSGPGRCAGGSAPGAPSSPSRTRPPPGCAPPRSSVRGRPPGGRASHAPAGSRRACGSCRFRRGPGSLRLRVERFRLAHENRALLRRQRQPLRRSQAASPARAGRNRSDAIRFARVSTSRS